MQTVRAALPYKLSLLHRLKGMAQGAKRRPQVPNRDGKIGVSRSARLRNAARYAKVVGQGVVAQLCDGIDAVDGAEKVALRLGERVACTERTNANDLFESYSMMLHLTKAAHG